VVCGAIAFNSNQVPTRPFSIDDGQIDEKSGLSDLLLHDIPVFS